jgi:hypothetical protein
MMGFVLEELDVFAKFVDPSGQDHNLTTKFMRFAEGYFTTFYVRRYLEDFKVAVNKYVAEIGLDIKKFNEAKKVVKGEFQLI